MRLEVMATNDKGDAMLTIVIPCLNRHDLLRACLRSIDAKERESIEVVVVDDGSEPELLPTITDLLTTSDRVIRQGNRGRAGALRAGILAAGGSYMMVMDSDDEFVPGALDAIVGDLRSSNAQLLGFVYECVGFDSHEAIARLPEGEDLTLLGIRADLGVKGDLKEVVRTTAVQECLYPDPGAERRVPTSYLWAGVSSHGKVRTRALPAVRHRYLPGGMSSTIKKLKADNPYWLARAHWKAAVAPREAYMSSRFRMLKAIKALSVRGAIFEPEELMQMRDALGLPAYWLSVLVAWVLRRS